LKTQEHTKKKKKQKKRGEKKKKTNKKKKKKQKNKKKKKKTQKKGGETKTNQNIKMNHTKRGVIERRHRKQPVRWSIGGGGLKQVASRL